MSSVAPTCNCRRLFSVKTRLSCLMRSAIALNVRTRAFVVGRSLPHVSASVSLSFSAKGELITINASGARVLHRKTS